MTVSFSRTRNQIATMVLGKLGIAAPSSADSDIVYEAMDMRLKEMHRLGIFWRKVSTTPATFSLTANVATASATADILFPISMTVMDTSLDEPVFVIGLQEYAKIENKAEAGLPTKAMWRGGTEFIFHPVPTAATTAKLVYERIADDTSASAAADIEVSMIRWMKDIIAYDIGDTFGQPEQKMIRLMKESEIAERNIRKLAVERKDFATVAVDSWGPDPMHRKTDYGL